MSLIAMDWARKQTLAQLPGQKHILLLMADRAGDDGDGSFPSVKTLASESGYSERTVQRILKALAKCGAIAHGNTALVNALISRPDRRPNCYRLCIERGDIRDKNGVTSVHPRGDICDMNGVTPVSPEPSIEPSIEPSNTPLPPSPAKAEKRPIAEKPPALIKPDSVTETVWADFTTLRKAKHAPLTQTAVDGIEREARKAKVSLQTALETCCARGWQGFRADWYAAPARNGSKYAGAARAIFGPAEEVGSYV